jgi:hypothetical protein
MSRDFNETERILMLGGHAMIAQQIADAQTKKSQS